MCDPVTAAVVVGVMSTASAAAGAVAQTKTANRQTDAINRQRTVVREETRQQATAEIFDRTRAARHEQGKIRAASGQAGLSMSSGGSLEDLLLDSAMQMELANDRTMANMESRQRANEAEADSMMSRIQKPTALGAGLQIASAAASGWAGVSNAQQATSGWSTAKGAKLKSSNSR